MEIKIFSTSQILGASLSQELHRQIINFSSKDKRINIALSGGSTPDILYKELLEKYAAAIDWNIVNLYWVDERCVPPNHPDSNYGNARQSFIKYIPIPPGNIHRIMGEEDPFLEARRYSEDVLKYVQLKNNLPCFNITLLGIGEDGHTASIFPDQIHLIDSAELYSVSLNPQGQSRITMTGKLINNSDYVYFAASGNTKAKVIGAILNREKDSEMFPAAHIKPESKNLFWYLDSDAAQYIRSGEL